MSQCLIKQTCHEDYGGVEAYLHTIIPFAIGGGEWSASRSGLFTSRETGAGTHWTGCRMGPRTGLDAVEKTKISTYIRNRTTILVSTSK
jgi:hypothetical protein